MLSTLSVKVNPHAVAPVFGAVRLHGVCLLLRFNLGRLMSTNASGRQTALKSHCLSAETEKHTEIDTPNYLPLVSASG